MNKMNFLRTLYLILTLALLNAMYYQAVHFIVIIIVATFFVLVAVWLFWKQS
jgi:hypothetical protein